MEDSLKLKRSRKANEEIELLLGSDIETSHSADMDTVLKLIQTKSSIADKSFMICNLSAIINQVLRWKSLLPRVRPFYAVKANPDFKMVSLLCLMGLGFDCSRSDEISLVLQALERKRKIIGNSVDTGSNIIFANTCKFQKDIDLASQHEINLTTFDNEIELDKLNKHWPTVGLVLRVKPLRKFNVTIDLGSRFGAAEEDIPKLLMQVKKYGMQLAGVSFHVGCVCKDSTAWAETIVHCRQVFDEAIALGLTPYLLDIGGGFPGFSNVITDNKYEQDLQDFFHSACESINESLDKYFPRNSGYTIIGEPGNYFVMDCMNLATQVIGKNYHHFYFDKNDERHMKPGSDTAIRGFGYTLSDGVYGCFNPYTVKPRPLEYFKLFSSKTKQFLDESQQEQEHTRLYGPTCDSTDIIRDHILLPELHLDDWIVWTDFGAYTSCLSTTFNGMECPDFHYLLAYTDLELIKDQFEDHLAEI